MHPTELESEFDSAAATESVVAHLDFVKKLLASSREGIVEYHWDLLRRLKDKNKKLYHHLTAAFAKRGKNGEEFLKSQVSRESDRELRAAALRLLGKLQSESAREFALDFLGHSHADDRLAGVLVLGWVGIENDVQALGELLLSDPAPINRGYAATALRQLYWRREEGKSSIRSYLGKAVFQEQNSEALRLIVISLQSLLGKDFGLVEDLDENTIRGDEAAARELAIAALASFSE